ncbi:MULTISPECIES: hypothetical protein [unclassified Moorena]|uniref:hypothetical protein n=1 Tax=unclassified Moorena TaxID=2683338 RepID=UPI0013F73830|nr:MULTISPECIES: hypothetical protein [unclassified Moorena]NEO14403.1 hypothetical protein [Moorena sp. SIO3E8]NEP27972.1 hypothetical protein [Moorena sp. SIO3I6]NEQ00814.1 hypothetical protein [Moorena sp. SIO3F7]
MNTSIRFVLYLQFSNETTTPNPKPKTPSGIVHLPNSVHSQPLYKRIPTKLIRLSGNCHITAVVFKEESQVRGTIWMVFLGTPKTHE